MRFILLGDGQAVQLAAVIKSNWPEASVKVFAKNITLDASSALCHSDWFDVDYLISQSEALSSPVIARLLEAKKMQHIRIPRVVFAGLHPDMFHAHFLPPLATGQPCYHSGIILASYLMGFSKTETMRHFNDDVFEALGYYDHFFKCREKLFTDLARFDLDGPKLVSKWLRKGSFAFSIDTIKC